MHSIEYPSFLECWKSSLNAAEFSCQLTRVRLLRRSIGGTDGCGWSGIRWIHRQLIGRRGRLNRRIFGSVFIRNRAINVQRRRFTDIFRHIGHVFVGFHRRQQVDFSAQIVDESFKSLTATNVCAAESRRDMRHDNPVANTKRD